MSEKDYIDTTKTISTGHTYIPSTRGKKYTKQSLYRKARDLYGYTGKYVGATKEQLISFINKSSLQYKPKLTKKLTHKSELYKKAKSLGFKGPYVGTTVGYLEEIVANLEHRSKVERLIERLIKFPTSNESKLKMFNKDDTGEEVLLSFEDINDLLPTLKYDQNYKYFIRINDTIVKTLNTKFLSRLHLVGHLDAYEPYESDPEVILTNSITSISIEKELRIKLKGKGNKRKEKGLGLLDISVPSNGFYPFVLTKYVTKNNTEDFKLLRDTWNRYVPEENSHTDCVGNCIQIAEIEQKIPIGSFDKYIAFRLKNNNNFEIRQKDWKPLAENLGIYIKVHKVSDSCNDCILHYNKTGGDRILELYSYQNHCFLYEEVNFTKWSLSNGYRMDHCENIIKIGKKINKVSYNPKLKNPYAINKEKQGISSIDFIRIMTANEELVEPMCQEDKYDNIKFDFKITHECDIVSGFNVCENVTKKAKSPFFMKKDKENKEDIPDSDKYGPRIYADFETIMHEGKHFADMLVTKCDGVRRKYLYHGGKLPSELFMNDIYNGKYGQYYNYVVIFHNLGYDFNFIANTPGVCVGNRLAKSSSKLMCATTYYYGKTIYFKDSYSVIPEALSQFSEMFGFEEARKGICPYNLYNIKTIKEPYANIKEAEKHIKKNLDKGPTDSSNKYIFRKSIEPYINPNNPTEFDHNKHRLDYCIQDVDILERGYEEFRKWTLELFDEELDFCVSIPQIAHNHFNNNGAFEGVAEVSEIAQAYLDNFIVGGRCMSANNKKYILRDVADFDANTLYPSGCCRDDFIVPKGRPRKLNHNEIDNFDINNYSCCYLSINILEVGKQRAFPLIRTKERGFINDPDPDEVIYMTKVTLLDALLHHKIKYRILGGIVFDNENGINARLGEIMNELYIERCKLKKEGKKSQLIMKLIMNAAYGRMIMKPHDTDERIFSQYKEGQINHMKYKEYTHKYYNYISEIVEIDSMAIVTKYKSVLDHSNHVHIGINILDMSKRIMNEVMCLAEDNDIPIFYQDTDSMHLYDKDVKKLCGLYQDKYGRGLEGKAMGQFCTDFDDIKGFKDPISKKCIIVGKKAYIDVIEYTSIADPTLKIEKNHIRMKGTPKDSILYKCENENITPYQLYKQLYDGKEKVFDLLANGGVSFEFNNFKVTSKNHFVRRIKF